MPDNTFKKVYAKIIEANCTPAGKDPLGAVSGGSLRITGPLLKLGKNRDIFLSYDSDEFRREELSCLFIGEFDNLQRSWAVRGLILRQQCMSTSTFERVGCFELDSGMEVGLLQGVEDSIVTIV
jgi:hypothetical protein